MSAPDVIILREMVRADLELAFDHLNNDLPELAEIELRKALEKVAQVRAALAIARIATPQLPLTLTLDDHQHETRNSETPAA